MVDIIKILKTNMKKEEFNITLIPLIPFKNTTCGLDTSSHIIFMCAQPFLKLHRYSLNSVARQTQRHLAFGYLFNPSIGGGTRQILPTNFRKKTANNVTFIWIFFKNKEVILCGWNISPD